MELLPVWLPTPPTLPPQLPHPLHPQTQFILYCGLFPLLETLQRLPIAFIIKSRQFSFRSFMVSLLINCPPTTCPHVSAPFTLHSEHATQNFGPLLEQTFSLLDTNSFLCLDHSPPPSHLFTYSYSFFRNQLRYPFLEPPRQKQLSPLCVQ